MARTPSTMLELGTALPDFSLLDTRSGTHTGPSDQPDAKAVVVMFICNHCPYVVRIREGLAALGRDYAAKDVAIYAISSNDVANYPDDSPEKMTVEAKTHGYTFPYLFDADQSVAKAFHAACTPEFYVFDRTRALVYRGQFDGARPGNAEPVTGESVRAALDATLNGTPVSDEQRPSVGCNIKWQPGNAPSYFG
ncbi:MAG: thioredoxin family protein [Myxococcota bacterium]